MLIPLDENENQTFLGISRFFVSLLDKKYRAITGGYGNVNAKFRIGIFSEEFVRLVQCTARKLFKNYYYHYHYYVIWELQ